MNATAGLDPAAARLQARRRARAYAPHFLQQAVERGLLERLEPVRLAPRRVLLAEAARSGALLALAQRFAGAELFATDDDPAALAALAARVAPARSGLLARLGIVRARPLANFLVAEPARLPLASGSVDLVWSVLNLHATAEPDPQIAEWRRVLAPGGLAAFACLGVDTLAELRTLGARIQRFPDMHDLGDALVRQGFAEPVVDTERLTITWRDGATLLAEVRQWGGNALADRFRGLLTPRHRQEWSRALEDLRDRDGLIRVSVELIYGHAWCPPDRRLPDGLAPIRVIPRGGR
ncbi:MAG: methyltransferase domain-containing protein [Betaproteobacteria bacterium]|nr:methyltransferase domain-containing protein [Betaproteobacteria bacterium]